MGYEKLLLQGIPYSRLLLGPETEVQLSDLYVLLQTEADTGST
jgi:hypothetical protein